jgi:hypothetical protein
MWNLQSHNSTDKRLDTEDMRREVETTPKLHTKVSTCLVQTYRYIKGNESNKGSDSYRVCPRNIRVFLQHSPSNQ